MNFKDISCSAILLAAGESRRFLDFGIKKQFVEIEKGKTVLEYVVEKFLDIPFIKQIIVTINKKDFDIVTKIISKYKEKQKINLVFGGKERYDSVYNAVKVLNNKVSFVLIHDIARPLVTKSLIYKFFEEIGDFDGVIPVIEINDTVKIIDKDGKKVIKTLDRDNLALIQTPQVFKKEVVTHIYSRKILKKWTKMLKITDDSQLAELEGYKIKVIPGETNNIKITKKDDLEFIYSKLNIQGYLVGFGYDCHRIVKKRKLFLGGILIDKNWGLKGHSDADVILHSICDALLSVVGEKDIGELFPDTEGKFRNISSLEITKKVLNLVYKKGIKIQNIDLVLICDKPKISNFKHKILSSLKDIFKIENINIKGKTTEGIKSFKNHIQCYSVVLVKK